MATTISQPAPIENYRNSTAYSGPDPLDRYFEISLFGLLSTGFLTLASTGRMDLFSMSVMGLALVGRALLLWRGNTFLLSPVWVSRVAIAYIPFFFFDIVFLEASAVNALERGLLAVIHLLFFAAVVKLFSASQTRDYVFLAALAFAQMLAASTLTIGTAFLLCFALFLLLAISTFASLEIRRARERASGFRSLAIPAGGKQAGFAAALGATSIIICTGVVLLTIVLFFVIPRGNRGFFSSLSRPSDRMTGFSDDVTLGQIGQIKKSSAVVMHIDAPDLRSSDGVKWRGIGLTTFDGKRWYNPSEVTLAVPGNRSFRFAQNTVHPGAFPKLLNYSVTLEPIASDAVFVAPQPRELIGPFRHLWEDNTGSVFMPPGSGALVRYSVLSDIAVPVVDALRANQAEIPPAIQQIYLQLPPTDPRVYELAEEITTPYASNYDKAKAIEIYLQTNYTYSLDLAPALPADPIAYFLWESRSGHCEFFASAMAVLLRAVGIPVRLVNGFLQGQYNDLSSQFTVRASDAHTWVEVYFPELGWVAFDPTPADGRLTQTLWLGRFALYIDAFQTFWEEWIINYDFIHQVTLARQLESSSREMRTDSRQYVQQRYRNLVAALRDYTDRLLQHRALMALVVALMMVGIVALYGRTALFSWFGDWGLQRRARQGKARPEDATVLYLRLLRLFARRGVCKLPSQTPNEFAESVPEPARPLVRDFTKLYLESRFGLHATSVPRLTKLLSQIQSEPRPEGYGGQ